MIHARNLCLSFGTQIIFDDISFSLDASDRIGLVGPNGTGKSTLLKTLVEPDILDSGTVIMQKGLKIGYLPQHVVLNSDKTVLEEARATFSRFYSIEQRLVELEREIDTGMPGAVLEEYSSLQHEYALFNVQEIDHKIMTILTGLGFTQEYCAKSVNELSVGWKMRLVLAKLLLQDADFYFFDEPTNHLDIVAKDWFLEFLRTAPFGFMFVSHERYFLDKACTKILALYGGKAKLYTGNYTAYEKQYEHDMNMLEAAYNQQQKEIKRKTDTINRFRAKSSKAKMVKSMMRELDKVERIVLPPRAQKVSFSFPATERAGKIVTTIKGVSHAFGTKTLFSDINCTIERGQKIALIAPNGTGKSTLLNLMMGRLSLQKGNIEFGYNVIPAFFAQDQNKELDGEATVLDNVLATSETISEQKARNFLGSFLFANDAVNKKVKVLSGGEKNKVSMVRVLLQQANFLILDEPTNHLDLQAKDILAQALQNYTGTLLFVSHDHQFINAVATHIIELTHEGAYVHEGNYDAYMYHKNSVAQESETGNGTLQTQVSSKQGQVTSAQRYELQKKSKKLEKKIASLESVLAKLHQGFVDLEYGTDVFDQQQQRVAQAEQELQALLDEWEALEERLN